MAASDFYFAKQRSLAAVCRRGFRGQRNPLILNRQVQNAAGRPHDTRRVYKCALREKRNAPVARSALHLGGLIVSGTSAIALLLVTFPYEMLPNHHGNDSNRLKSQEQEAIFIAISL